MFKDNGRLKQADKKDVANVKGKEMVCISCGTFFTVQNAEFAAMSCTKCGASLIDKHEFIKYK
jgi:predicted nucleic-acid-binding Zn-ribbon protein